MNQDSLKVSNVYAAYSTPNSQTRDTVSTLSKMVGKDQPKEGKEKAQVKSLSMDKVVISKEGLEALAKRSEIKLLDTTE